MGWDVDIASSGLTFGCDKNHNVSEPIPADIVPKTGGHGNLFMDWKPVHHSDSNKRLSQSWLSHPPVHSMCIGDGNPLKHQVHARHKEPKKRRKGPVVTAVLKPVALRHISLNAPQLSYKALCLEWNSGCWQPLTLNDNWRLIYLPVCLWRLTLVQNDFNLINSRRANVVMVSDVVTFKSRRLFRTWH